MFFFNETLIYMKKGFLVTFVIIICTAVSIVLSNLTSLIVHEAETDKKKYTETYADGKYYGIGDKLMGDVEEVFVKREDYVQVLEDMNRWLHNNEYFKYFEGRADHISYINKDIEGEFKNTYNDQLKAYWLGFDDIEHFDIQVKEGRMFDKNDFVHNENMTNEPGKLCTGEIPVIVGPMLRDRFEIGDTIEMYNVFHVGTAKVIGILESNSKTVNTSGNNIYVLDDSVILPFFDSFSGSESAKYKRMIYLQKNNGKLYSKLKAEELQEIVNEYTSFLKIAGAYFVFGASNQWQAVFTKNLDDMIDNIGRIAIGITCFSALSLAVYLFIKIKRSERYFGIMAINGYTKSQIRNLIISEVTVIITASLILGVIGTVLVHNVSFQEYDINYITGLIPIIVTSVLGLSVGIYGIESQELSGMITGKE